MDIERFPRRVRIIVVSGVLNSNQITAAITVVPDTVTDVVDRQGELEATWEIYEEGTGEDDISEMLERILERIQPVGDHVAALIDEGLAQ